MSQSAKEELTQDPYTILNIPIDADYQQIKEKYYLYSRIFHPDKQSAHLYKESRSQFEEIDKAYKAISNPFLKLIYDNFGYSGIKIYTEHPNKFIDLEQQYIQTYEQREQHKHEYKLSLQILKKEILQRMNHLYELYREEKNYINCFRNISINADFSAIQYVQQRPIAFKNKQLLLTRLSFVPMLYLPDIKKLQIQHEIGFSASAAGLFGQQQDFNGGCLYKVSKKIPTELKYIGGSDIKGSFFHSYKSSEATIELSTNPVKDLNMTGSVRIGKFGVIPILSFNREIDNTSSVNSQITLIDGISDANIGFVKVFSNPKIRLDFDTNINENELNTELMLSKNLNKKFSILGGYVQKGEIKQNHINLKFYFCIGWKILFNSHNFLEVRSYFGIGNNEVQIRLMFNSYNKRFKRNGLITQTPVSFGLNPSLQTVMYSFLSGTISGLALYQYQKLKSRSKKKQMLILKKNKNRLLEERSTFNIQYDEIKEKIADKLNIEISSNGLVILKSYGGDRHKIKQIRKVFNKKENKLPYQSNQDVLMNTLNREIDIGLNLEDKLCEVVEITSYIQNKVNHSYIDTTYTEIANQQGLFNPCIDSSCQTSIYIQYSYKGKVQDIIIQSGDVLRIGNVNSLSSLKSSFRKLILSII